jgi:hypothetical protein
MPYYLERRGSRYKLRLKDDPQHEFSSKYMTKKQAVAQMQAIEISKRRRNMERGGSFLSDMLGKIKRGFNSVISTLGAPAQTIVSNASNILGEKTQYTDSVKDVLSKYGNFGITSMILEKQPVDDKIMFLVNKITNDLMRELMIKHNIDAYYHISLRVDVIDDTGNIIPFRIEKNENISITPYKPLPNSQYLQVPLDAVPRTMNSILTKTRLDIGEDHFYLYRFDSWNCADFIMEILRSNGLLTQQNEGFIYQNTDIIKKQIPQSTRSRVHLITKFASRIGHLRGRGIEQENSISGFRFI